MNDFVSRLAARALRTHPMVQPLVAPRFAPAEATPAVALDDALESTPSTSPRDERTPARLPSPGLAAPTARERPPRAAATPARIDDAPTVKHPRDHTPANDAPHALRATFADPSAPPAPRAPWPSEDLPPRDDTSPPVEAAAARPEARPRTAPRDAPAATRAPPRATATSRDTDDVMTPTDLSRWGDDPARVTDGARPADGVARATTRVVREVEARLAHDDVTHDAPAARASPAAPAAPPPPVVRVTIGRIELRAPPSPARATTPRAAPRTHEDPLDDYLRRRAQGGTR